MAKKKKPEYSVKIGLQKTAKNVLVMFILPAVIYILSNVTEFVPEEDLVWAVPLAGAVGYFVKNYLQNK